jgi:hypothetical protein
MPPRVPAHVKSTTPFHTSTAPVCARSRDTSYLAWTDRDTGFPRVAHGHDLRDLEPVLRIDEPTELGLALVSGPIGLLLAFVPAASGVVRFCASSDGRVWHDVGGRGLRAAGGVRLLAHEDRYWLLRVAERTRGGEVMSSPDGVQWDREAVLPLPSRTLPDLVVIDERPSLVWLDPDGRLVATPIDAPPTATPSLLHRGPLHDPYLSAAGDGLRIAWADPSTGLLHVQQRTTRRWEDLAILHERLAARPCLLELDGGSVVVGVRADRTASLEVLRPADAAVIEPVHVFRGDVQGHPTALTSEHHTPFPYLGIVARPSDWPMPKGQTTASLTTSLTNALAATASFWSEASFGRVQITSQVHPTVVTLPSPMATYLIRARPKLIDGYGAIFPVTFVGTETLDLKAAGGFTLTVTFPSGARTLEQVVATINDAVDAGGYAGPAASKPLATTSDLGQLRIRTADKVDAGDPLEVAGGSAVSELGLDAASRTVYEGSTTQVEHLDVLLRDALQVLAATQPDPASFLRGFYGVVVCLASNLGWYALRACASLGPSSIAVLPGQPDHLLATYLATLLDSDDVHAHEVGHNLGLPDLYEEGARNVGAEPGRWDVMDSNSFSHPCAWTKSYASAPKHPASRWLDAALVSVLDAATQSVEVLLAPIESPSPTTNPFASSHPGVPLRQAIRIELDPNHAFYVENRQRGPYTDPAFGTITHSTHLPGSGLIVTDAVDDVTLTGLGRSPLVMVHPYGFVPKTVPDAVIDQVVQAATMTQKQAIVDALVPATIPQWLADRIARAQDRPEIERLVREYEDGQVRACYPVDQLGEEVVAYRFPDGAGEIRVKLVEILGSHAPYVYRVQASWGRPGSWFDLMIRRWTNPPPYESPDIWVDSEANGWDVYEHSDPTANPDVAGNPVHNGDRPWVGHDNRVRARVWNRGDLPQNNVRVDFRVVVPPGPSSGYVFGTDHIDIPAGGSAIATATWRPLTAPADQHACIAVDVEYRAWDLAAQVVGEHNSDNNTAQENITDFYLAKGSPYTEVELPFEFVATGPEPQEMKLRARGLEPGWTLRVRPYRFRLEPGERIEGTLVLEADDNVPLEGAQEGRPAPVVSLEALVRTPCTWRPIGGFSMIAHTVRASFLDVGVDPSGTGLHVSLQARDAAGPIAGAGVALRLVLAGERTLSVARVTTGSDGHATCFIPIAPDDVPPGAALAVDVQLAPHGQSAPATALIPVPTPTT